LYLLVASLLLIPIPDTLPIALQRTREATNASSMSLLLCSSLSLQRLRAAAIRPATASLQCRGKKTQVRIIAIQDLPNGKAFENDVVSVAAGYARNYLIPQKLALYATRTNFRKLGIQDPELETPEDRRLRLEREAASTENQDYKDAERLRKYLRTKTVRSRRKSNGMSHHFIDKCFYVNIHQHSIVTHSLPFSPSLPLSLNSIEFAYGARLYHQHQ